jgi:hypothetical protein
MPFGFPSETAFGFAGILMVVAERRAHHPRVPVECCAFQALWRDPELPPSFIVTVFQGPGHKVLVRWGATAHKGSQAPEIPTVPFEWYLFLQTKCVDDFFVGAPRGSQYSRPPDDIRLEIPRLLKKIDDLQNCTATSCMKNRIAHRTDRFVVLWSIVLVIPVDMMNHLPLQSSEATVATCVIVTSADTDFYFFPNSGVFFVSNDACVGVTLDHDMKIPRSPAGCPIRGVCVWGF